MQKIESFIAEQVRDIASELLADALENGDVIATAETLKSQIIAGWVAALEAIDTPAELIESLSLA